MTVKRYFMVNELIVVKDTELRKKKQQRKFLIQYFEYKDANTIDQSDDKDAFGCFIPV